MKTRTLLTIALLALLGCSACIRHGLERETPEERLDGLLTLEDVAVIFSDLPLGKEHLDEVYDAVSSSSGNGYDEEYTMAMLLTSPGSGVGDAISATRSSSYAAPLRDLLADYLSDRCATRSGSSYLTRTGTTLAEDYIASLTVSDMQIYWPYSEDWDGKTFPIITFDPGFGAEANIGYRIRFDEHGEKQVNQVLVTEEIARREPVWVINHNDDSAYTPADMFVKSKAGLTGGSGREDQRTLSIKSFKMLRNYDSWFGGASEFFVKCGAPDGFAASTDEDLKLYTPSVTDFMVVVKRRDVGKDVPFDAILLTDYTQQMDKIAFLVVEDDGGTTTSWKCQTTVKYNSKSYGFDISIPYHDKDDIVWRGQISNSFFPYRGQIVGRFGDVVITFELR